jgi:hypothetical protein
MSINSEIKELFELMQAGALTEQEFQAQKTFLLSREKSSIKTEQTPENRETIPNDKTPALSDEQSASKSSLKLIGLVCPHCSSFDIGQITGKEDYLCAHCTGKSFKPVQSKVPNPNPDEKVFFQKGLLHTAVGPALVRITSHRAILGDKTYALANIAAVQLYSNEEETKAANDSINSGNTAKGISAFILLMVAVAMVNITKSFWGLIFIVAAGLMVGKIKKADADVTYAVRVMAAGSPTDTIVTKNKDTSAEIVQALNDAIVNLNVAKNS